MSLTKTNENEEKDNTFIQKKSSIRKDNKNFNILNSLNNTNRNNRTKIIEKDSNQNKIIFDNHISISFSNILNSDCILLNRKNKKFLQYNGVISQIFQDNTNIIEKIQGYNIHSMNQSKNK